MRSAKPYLPAVTIFVLALGLRLFAIDRQSLWYDEGLTAALVQRAPAEIVRAAAADVHPPLFYLLLHAWVMLFGASEAALRSFSALCGALAAALTVVLGRRWFGAAAGALAGVAAVVSPLGVYYGQEARMYALAALLAVVMWLGLDLWRTTWRRRWLMVYGIAALAGLLTHYVFVTVVAPAGVLGLLAAAPERGPDVRIAAWLRAMASARLRAQRVAWLLLHVGLAAAYLWLALGSRSTLAGWAPGAQWLSPAVVVLDGLRALALGPVAPLQAMPWLTLSVVLLAALALWPAPLKRVERAMAAAWLLTPLAVLVLLSLGQPYYKPRFLLPALPAFHLLLGAGAAALAARLSAHTLAARAQRPVEVNRGHEPPAFDAPTRSLSLLQPALLPVLAGLLTLASIEPLAHTYFDPRTFRDDYRGLAGAITATARPDDAVLLVGPGQLEPLDYYLKLPLVRYPLPRTRPLDAAATVGELEAMARVHRRVYSVLYVPRAADPEALIDGWLRRNAFPATRRWYGGVELAVYELGGIDAPETRRAARFGGMVRLLGARLAPAELRPGDALRVEVRWTAETPLAPLLVFAHLVDAQGRIVAQFDGPPAPEGSETWTVAQEHTGRLALLLPPDAAPGAYRLLIGLYDPASGARMPLADGGDSLELGIVRVVRRASE